LFALLAECPKSGPSRFLGRHICYTCWKVARLFGYRNLLSGYGSFLGLGWKFTCSQVGMWL